MDAATPELMQIVLGQGQMTVRPPEQVSAEIRLLAKEVCRAHPETFKAGGTVPVGEEVEYAAYEYFTSWGGGWFENDVFLLRGYTYDDVCHCGSFDRSGSVHPDLAAAASSKEEMDALSFLACACSEGGADLLRGGQRIELPANFWHKPSGYMVEWYKHPSRGVNANAPLEDLKIREIFSECLASIDQIKVATAEIDHWPTNLARPEAFAENSKLAAEVGGERALEIYKDYWGILMDRVYRLEKLGVHINPEYEWVGEVGTPERKQVRIPSSVAGATLPLTPDDWCRIAMREGEEYVGGCCGNMGVLQDEINGVFRDSGYAEAHTLLVIGEAARGHEGFDEFQEMDDERFEELVDRWNDLGPWAKIGVLYNAVEPALKLQRFGAISPRRDALQELSSTLHRMSWNDLVTVGDEEKATHEAGRLVLAARALDPTRELLAELEEMEPFEGFAIVGKGTDQLFSNMRGLCLYATQEEAERVLEISSRRDDAEEGEVVAVRVTVEDGIKIER